MLRTTQEVEGDMRSTVHVVWCGLGASPLLRVCVVHLGVSTCLPCFRSTGLRFAGNSSREWPSHEATRGSPKPSYLNQRSSVQAKSEPFEPLSFRRNDPSKKAVHVVADVEKSDEPSILQLRNTDGQPPPQTWNHRSLQQKTAGFV
jgi:hypothetical protein